MLGKTAFRAALLASVALVSGCAAVPDLGARPQLADPASLESARSFEGVRGEWPADRWWLTYGDEQLAALIEEGLAGSPNLAAAAARARQAQAASQQTGAARLPSVSAKSSFSAAQVDLSGDNIPETISDNLPSEWTTRGSSGLQLDYQLDFFGRNRAAFAAATSGAKAAAAEEASARLQLSTSIALAYADLTCLYADHAAAENNVRLREDSAKLVHARLDSGLENDGQAAQSDSSLEQARADLVSVNGAIARTRNQIAALLGKGPDRGLDIAPPRTLAPKTTGLPTSLGLDLIGRRPDLVAARLRAEAAAKRIDVARADFYPNVNLSAMIGLQTLGLDRISGGSLATAEVGPAISLPIFSGGKLSGAYKGARAEYDEAVALYNQSLANALRETADAIADRRTLDQEFDHTQRAFAAAYRSYTAMRQRYEAGIASYIDVLSVENNLVAQQRAVADLQARAFALDVSLIRALGGGFNAS